MNKPLRKSGWLKIKNTINSYKIGDTILRQTLIRNIKGVPVSTIDGYRNRLQQLHILESAGRGKYKLLQKIPEDMNTVIIIRLLANQTYTPHVKWFMPIQDRVDRLVKKKGII